MDVMGGEDWFDRNFELVETEPLNESYEQFGIDNKTFVFNSGSYFHL